MNRMSYTLKISIKIEVYSRSATFQWAAKSQFVVEDHNKTEKLVVVIETSKDTLNRQNTSKT